MLSKYFLVYLTLVFFATSLAVADHNAMGDSHGSAGRPVEEPQKEIVTEIDAEAFRPVKETLSELEERVYGGLDLQLKKKSDRYSTGERSADEPQ